MDSDTYCIKTAREVKQENRHILQLLFVYIICFVRSNCRSNNYSKK